MTARVRPTLGVFVGEKGNWSFFREICDDLSTRYRVEPLRLKTYDTPLLYGRLNRWAFRRGIESLLKRSDVAFFEWASELLEPASRMDVRCPIVTRLHSYEIYFWAPRMRWDGVCKIILVSEAMRQKFCQIYPDQVHKTVVIHNGVALDRYRPPQGRQFRMNLGMLCSLHPRKRVYDMVLVVHALKQAGYRPHLHVAGGAVHGPDMDEYFVALHRICEKLGLQRDVTYYDQMADPSGWLQSIDVFISNSYWEGNQVALIEAMASGCYCLSHFWDGAEEVVPEHNLFASEAELRDKIAEYADLRDSEKLLRQSQMRDIACQKFDIEITKAKVRDVLQEVGTGGRRPSPRAGVV